MLENYQNCSIRGWDKKISYLIKIIILNDERFLLFFLFYWV